GPYRRMRSSVSRTCAAVSEGNLTSGTALQPESQSQWLGNDDPSCTINDNSHSTDNAMKWHYRTSDERQRFDVRLATREACEVEGRRVHRDGAAVHERLGHELTGDGTVHEAVATEAGDDVESRDAGDGADDARLIRRHLVEAGVRTHELRLRERGRAVDRALEDARLETAVDLRAEADRLYATAVTPQQART